jgi:hypothetical protein
MRYFKDSSGREWTISITIGAAMLLKEKLGIDLLQPEQGTPPLVTRLGTDEILLAQTIATLLEKQFDEKKVSLADIYDLFDGATLEAAHKAFYEDLIDFFQKSGREDRATMVRRQMEVILVGVEKMKTRIEGIDIQARLDQEIQRMEAAQA